MSLPKDNLFNKPPHPSAGRCGGKHFWLMVAGCVLPLVVIAAWLFWSKGVNDYIIWLLVLLCPLAHIFMMRGHGHGGQTARHTESEQTSAAKFYSCPECGLRYAELNWAKQCEAWCRKYHSCNLAITKHAVKD